MDLSHREQKKLQTRQALITSAMSLFTEQGFDKTSLAEITERANCAPRTFFLYFDSKEDLLPAAIELGANQLKDAVMQRRADQDTVDIVRDWMKAGLTHHAPAKALHDPALEIRKQYYLAQYLQPILTSAFAHDLGIDEDAMEAKLLAASAIGLLNSFNFELSIRKRQEFLDRASELLKSQIEQLQR